MSTDAHRSERDAALNLLHLCSSVPHLWPNLNCISSVAIGAPSVAKTQFVICSYDRVCRAKFPALSMQSARFLSSLRRARSLCFHLKRFNSAEAPRRELRMERTSFSRTVQNLRQGVGLTAATWSGVRSARHQPHQYAEGQRRTREGSVLRNHDTRHGASSSRP